MARKRRTHTVYGLRDKREELLMHLRGLDDEREEIVLALTCLDATIDLFENPKIDTRRYAPVTEGPRHKFNRFLGDYLRASNGPVSVGPIAKAWLAQIGKEVNKETRNAAGVRIRLKFATLVKVGVLEEVKTSSPFKHWQLVR